MANELYREILNEGKRNPYLSMQETDPGAWNYIKSATKSTYKDFTITGLMHTEVRNSMRGNAENDDPAINWIYDLVPEVEKPNKERVSREAWDRFGLNQLGKSYNPTLTYTEAAALAMDREEQAMETRNMMVGHHHGGFTRKFGGFIGSAGAGLIDIPSWLIFGGPLGSALKTNTLRGVTRETARRSAIKGYQQRFVSDLRAQGVGSARHIDEFGDFIPRAQRYNMSSVADLPRPGPKATGKEWMAYWKEYNKRVGQSADPFLADDIMAYIKQLPKTRRLPAELNIGPLGPFKIPFLTKRRPGDGLGRYSKWDSQDAFRRARLFAALKADAPYAAVDGLKLGTAHMLLTEPWVISMREAKGDEYTPEQFALSLAFSTAGGLGFGYARSMAPGIMKQYNKSLRAVTFATVLSEWLVPGAGAFMSGLGSMAASLPARVKAKTNISYSSKTSRTGRVEKVAHDQTNVREFDKLTNLLNDEEGLIQAYELEIEKKSGRTDSAEERNDRKLEDQAARHTETEEAKKAHDIDEVLAEAQSLDKYAKEQGSASAKQLNYKEGDRDKDFGERYDKLTKKINALTPEQVVTLPRAQQELYHSNRPILSETWDEGSGNLSKQSALDNYELFLRTREGGTHPAKTPVVWADSPEQYKAGIEWFNEAKVNAARNKLGKPPLTKEQVAERKAKDKELKDAYAEIERKIEAELSPEAGKAREQSAIDAVVKALNFDQFKEGLIAKRDALGIEIGDGQTIDIKAINELFSSAFVKYKKMSPESQEGLVDSLITTLTDPEAGAVLRAAQMGTPENVRQLVKGLMGEMERFSAFAETSTLGGIEGLNIPSFIKANLPDIIRRASNIDPDTLGAFIGDPDKAHQIVDVGEPIRTEVTFRKKPATGTVDVRRQDITEYGQGVPRHGIRTVREQGVVGEEIEIGRKSVYSKPAEYETDEYGFEYPKTEDDFKKEYEFPSTERTGRDRSHRDAILDRLAELFLLNRLAHGGGIERKGRILMSQWDSRVRMQISDPEFLKNNPWKSFSEDNPLLNQKTLEPEMFQLVNTDPSISVGVAGRIQGDGDTTLLANDKDVKKINLLENPAIGRMLNFKINGENVFSTTQIMQMVLARIKGEPFNVDDVIYRTVNTSSFEQEAQPSEAAVGNAEVRRTTNREGIPYTIEQLETVKKEIVKFNYDLNPSLPPSMQTKINEKSIVPGKGAFEDEQGVKRYDAGKEIVTPKVDAHGLGVVPPAPGSVLKEYPIEGSFPIEKWPSNRTFTPLSGVKLPSALIDITNGRQAETIEPTPEEQSGLVNQSSWLNVSNTSEMVPIPGGDLISENLVTTDGLGNTTKSRVTVSVAGLSNEIGNPDSPVNGLILNPDQISAKLKYDQKHDQNPNIRPGDVTALDKTSAPLVVQKVINVSVPGEVEKKEHRKTSTEDLDLPTASLSSENLNIEVFQGQYKKTLGEALKGADKRQIARIRNSLDKQRKAIGKDEDEADNRRIILSTLIKSLDGNMENSPYKLDFVEEKLYKQVEGEIIERTGELTIAGSLKQIDEIQNKIAPLLNPDLGPEQADKFIDAWTWADIKAIDELIKIFPKELFSFDQENLPDTMGHGITPQGEAKVNRDLAKTIDGANISDKDAIAGATGSEEKLPESIGDIIRQRSEALQVMQGALKNIRALIAGGDLARSDRQAEIIPARSERSNEGAISTEQGTQAREGKHELDPASWDNHKIDGLATAHQIIADSIETLGQSIKLSKDDWETVRVQTSKKEEIGSKSVVKSTDEPETKYGEKELDDSGKIKMRKRLVYTFNEGFFKETSKITGLNVNALKKRNWKNNSVVVGLKPYKKDMKLTHRGQEKINYWVDQHQLSKGKGEAWKVKAKRNDLMDLHAMNNSDGVVFFMPKEIPKKGAKKFAKKLEQLQFAATNSGKPFFIVKGNSKTVIGGKGNYENIRDFLNGKLKQKDGINQRITLAQRMPGHSKDTYHNPPNIIQNVLVGGDAENQIAFQDNQHGEVRVAGEVVSQIAPGINIIYLGNEKIILSDNPLPPVLNKTEDSPDSELTNAVNRVVSNWQEKQLLKQQELNFQFIEEKVNPPPLTEEIQKIVSDAQKNDGGEDIAVNAEVSAKNEIEAIKANGEIPMTPETGGYANPFAHTEGLSWIQDSNNPGKIIPLLYEVVTKKAEKIFNELGVQRFFIDNSKREVGEGEDAIPLSYSINYGIRTPFTSDHIKNALDNLTALSDKDYQTPVFGNLIEGQIKELGLWAEVHFNSDMYNVGPDEAKQSVQALKDVYPDLTPQNIVLARTTLGWLKQQREILDKIDYWMKLDASAVEQMSLFKSFVSSMEGLNKLKDAKTLKYLGDMFASLGKGEFEMLKAPEHYESINIALWHVNAGNSGPDIIRDNDNIDQVHVNIAQKIYASNSNMLGNGTFHGADMYQNKNYSFARLYSPDALMGGGKSIQREIKEGQKVPLGGFQTEAQQKLADIDARELYVNFLVPDNDTKVFAPEDRGANVNWPFTFGITKDFMKGYPKGSEQSVLHWIEQQMEVDIHGGTAFFTRKYYPIRKKTLEAEEIRLNDNLDRAGSHTKEGREVADRLAKVKKELQNLEKGLTDQGQIFKISSKGEFAEEWAKPLFENIFDSLTMRDSKSEEAHDKSNNALASRAIVLAGPKDDFKMNSEYGAYDTAGENLVQSVRNHAHTEAFSEHFKGDFNRKGPRESVRELFPQELWDQIEKSIINNPDGKWTPVFLLGYKSQKLKPRHLLEKILGTYEDVVNQDIKNVGDWLRLGGIYTSLAGGAIQQLGDTAVAQGTVRDIFTELIDGGVIRDAMQVLKNPELTEALADLGLYADSFSDAIKRYDVGDFDKGSKVKRKLAEFFFTYTGISKITEANRAGFLTSVMKNMGAQAEKTYDELQPSLVEHLKAYGIEEGEWNLIRSGVSKLNWYMNENEIKVLPIINARFAERISDYALKEYGDARGLPVDQPENRRKILNDLRMKYVRFLNGERDRAIMVPDALDNLIVTRANKQGTAWRTTLQTAGMYKAFNLALLYKVLSPQYKKLFTGGKSGRIQAAQFLGYMLVFGVLISIIKDLLASRKPRMPWTRSGAWSAVKRSGVMGYADMLVENEWELPGKRDTLLGKIGDAFNFMGGPMAQQVTNFSRSVTAKNDVASDKAMVKAIGNAIPMNDLPMLNMLIKGAFIEPWLEAIDPQRAVHRQRYLEHNSSGDLF